MKWAKRHINWTLAIFTLLPFTSLLFDMPAPILTILIILAVAVSFWACLAKGRSFAWALLTDFSIFFLENKREFEGMSCIDCVLWENKNNPKKACKYGYEASPSDKICALFKKC